MIIYVHISNIEQNLLQRRMNFSFSEHYQSALRAKESEELIIEKVKYGEHISKSFKLQKEYPNTP